MNSLCEANSCPAKAKIVNKYPDLTIDWKKLYSLAFETILHTKLREFQHKIGMSSSLMSHLACMQTLPYLYYY